MRTLHYNKFIWVSIILAVGIASARGKSNSYQNLTVLILAVLSLGYGIKLRRLAKRGIKDTLELKKK